MKVHDCLAKAFHLRHVDLLLAYVRQRGKKLEVGFTKKDLNARLGMHCGKTIDYVVAKRASRTGHEYSCKVWPHHFLCLSLPATGKRPNLAV
jgi:hypothetical protein